MENQDNKTLQLSLETLRSMGTEVKYLPNAQFGPCVLLVNAKIGERFARLSEAALNSEFANDPISGLRNGTFVVRACRAKNDGHVCYSVGMAGGDRGLEVL